VDTQIDSDDTVAQLRGLLERLAGTGEHEHLLEAVSEVVGKITRENALLRSQIDELKRCMYGRSAEKIDRA